MRCRPYGLLISCPACESHDVERIASSNPDPFTGSLVFRCRPCDRSWHLAMSITSAPTGRRLQPERQSRKVAA